MAKTVSTVAVRLVANSATLQHDMAKAGGHVQGFADRVSGFAMKLGGTFAAMFAVSKIADVVSSSIRSITTSVNEAINSIDDLAKTAKRIGVATEDLQVFRLGANLAGISAESLTTAFRFSQRAMSEAASGTKEYAESFEALGLDAAALNLMKPAEQFKTILGALNRVSNQADRTRLAMELFGRTGTQMLTFDQSSLDDAAETLDRIGGAINSIEAAKVEEANDAMTRMKAAISTVWNELTIALAPAVKEIANLFVAMMPVVRPILDTMTDAIQRIGAVIGEMTTKAENIELIGRLVRIVLAPLNLFAAVLEKVADILERVNTKKLLTLVNVAASALAPFAAMAADMGYAFEKTSQVSFDPLADEIDRVQKAMEATDASARRLSDESKAPILYRVVIDGVERFYEAREAYKAMSRQSFDGLSSGLSKAESQALKTGKAINSLSGEGLEEATEAAKETEAALKAAAKAAEDFWEKHDRGADKLGEAQRAAERWSKEVESPGEKLTRQLAELQGLWNQRLISEDVFERGNAKIRADYEAASEAAKEVERSIDRIEGTPAILKGSAEDLAMIDRAQRALMEAQNAAAEAAKPDASAEIPAPKIAPPDTSPLREAIRLVKDMSGFDVHALGVEGSYKSGRDLLDQLATAQKEFDALLADRDATDYTWTANDAEDLEERRQKYQALMDDLAKASDREFPPIEIPPLKVPPVEAKVETPDLGQPVSDWAGRSMAEIESMMGALEGQQLHPYVEDIEPPQPRKLEPYVEDIEPPKPEPVASDMAGRLQQIQDAGKRMQEMTQAQQALLKIQERQAATLEAIEKNTKEKTKVTEATI